MSKMIIVEGNSNDKDNTRVFMVKGEKGDMGDLNHNDIVDNLTSTATNKVLSANQGKVLKNLIDANTNDILENTTNISNETSARQNADEVLQNQITGLASGSPLVASSTSGMTDTTRVYVNTTDGHWYYYDGTAWTDGGTYQSTGIADGSITFENLSDSLVNRLENKEFEVTWIQGSVNSADGHNISSDTRIRVNLFTPKISLLLKPKNGYKVVFYDFEYNSSDAPFTKTDWSTNPITLEYTEGHYYKIVLAKTDDSNITPSLGLNLEVEILDKVMSDIEGINNVIKYIEPSIFGNATYRGEKINLQNKMQYESSFNIPTNVSGQAVQGGAIYNNYFFQFYNQGYCNVYNLTTGVLLDTFKLDENLDPHCNAVCFSSVKYDNADEFPLIYLNAYNNTNLPKGTCYAYRLFKNSSNQFSASLIQTISIGFTTDPIWTDGSGDTRPYGNFTIDTENNLLYVYTLLDTTNVTRFFVFNLPSISNSNVVLNKVDIQKTFDVPYLFKIQDSTIQNDKIYIASGDLVTLHKLSVVDLLKEELVSQINFDDFNLQIEPESVNIYDNKLLITYNKLYKFTF